MHLFSKFEQSPQVTSITCHSQGNACNCLDMPDQRETEFKTKIGYTFEHVFAPIKIDSNLKRNAHSHRCFVDMAEATATAAAATTTTTAA